MWIWLPHAKDVSSRTIHSCPCSPIIVPVTLIRLPWFTVAELVSANGPSIVSLTRLPNFGTLRPPRSLLIRANGIISARCQCRYLPYRTGGLWHHEGGGTWDRNARHLVVLAEWPRNRYKPLGGACGAWVVLEDGSGFNSGYFGIVKGPVEITTIP